MHFVSWHLATVHVSTTTSEIELQPCSTFATFATRKIGNKTNFYSTSKPTWTSLLGFLTPVQCRQGSHSVTSKKHICFWKWGTHREAMINGSSLYDSTWIVSLQVKMEILREFLESSTIHGLSYISSSKVRPNNIYSAWYIMLSVEIHLLWWSMAIGQCCSLFFRQGQQRSFGLSLSVSVSLAPASSLANLTRSGRSPLLPPQ